MENEYEVLTPGDGVGGTLAAQESLEDSVREHAFPLPSPSGGNRCYWGAQGERTSADALPASCALFLLGLPPSNL